MKIELFFPDEMLFPLREGGRKQLFMHAQELKSAGHDVSITAFHKLPGRYLRKKRTQIIKGIKITHGNMFSTIKTKPDILHMYSYSPKQLYWKIKNSKAKKNIVTIADGEGGKVYPTKWFKICNKLFPFVQKTISKKTEVVVHTTYVKKILEPYFKKITTIPTYIPQIKKTKNVQKENNILFMTHFSKNKGVKEAIEAFEIIIKQKPRTFLIMADSGYRKKNKYIYRRINKSTARKNIILKEFVQPLEELAKVKVYIYPFHSAKNTLAVPLSAYEAEQAKTNIVISDVGGVKEYIPLEYLVPPKNSQQLAKKIIKFLNKTNKKKLKKINNKEVFKKIMAVYR